MNGRHVMMENVEQIGLKEEEERLENEGRRDRWHSWPIANNTKA